MTVLLIVSYLHRQFDQSIKVVGLSATVDRGTGELQGLVNITAVGHFDGVPRVEVYASYVCRADDPCPVLGFVAWRFPPASPMNVDWGGGHS